MDPIIGRCRKTHDEIKQDYLFAVKKSIVDFVLKEPEIDEDERFLDEDDETPMTIELAGTYFIAQPFLSAPAVHIFLAI